VTAGLNHKPHGSTAKPGYYKEGEACLSSVLLGVCCWVVGTNNGTSWFLKTCYQIS